MIHISNGISERTLLHQKGERITAQRLLLLDLINTEGHFDADELCARARKKYPRLSLSTVYRSLQLFRKLGLVDGHSFAEAHCHYEPHAAGEHYHLQCRQCGRIVEFSHPLIEEIKAEVGRKYDFLVKEADIYLTGLCPDCRQQK